MTPTATINELHGHPLPPDLFAASALPSLSFQLNTRRIVLSPQDTEVAWDSTLLEFIRAPSTKKKPRLTGTKLGCAEGGCGACTVVVLKPRSTIERHNARNGLAYDVKAVNACLMPLVAVHGCHIITVEGIGTADNPHPIQQRLAFLFGSQCGFCTPGIVMSFYATLRASNGRGLTEKQIERSLDGNLCRCTGYRPILDALKTFATLQSDREETADAEMSGPIVKDDRLQPCPRGSECCKVKKDQDQPGSCAAEPRPQPPVSSLDLARRRLEQTDLSKEVIDGEAPLLPYRAASEPIFPAWLLGGSNSADGDRTLFQRQDLAFVDVSTHREQAEEDDVETLDSKGSVEKAQTIPLSGTIWLRPASLPSLLSMISFYHSVGADTKLRSGDSECRIEVKFLKRKYSVNIFMGSIPALTPLTQTSQDLSIGANLPLSDIISRLEELLPTEGGAKGGFLPQVYKAVLSNAAHFASTQIRNVACVGGNVATASPISDLNPVWLALGGTVHYLDAAAYSTLDDDLRSDSVQSYKESSVPIQEFFKGYRKTALPATAIITRVTVPTNRNDSSQRRHFVRAYKQAKRKDDDIAIVTCCLYIEAVLSPGGNWRLHEARFAYGGMAPTTVCAEAAQKVLDGQVLNDARDGTVASASLLRSALEAMSATDFDLKHDVPGGMAVYRKTLALSFLAKFFGDVASELKLRAPVQDWLQSLDSLKSSELERPVTRGSHDYEKVGVNVAGGSGKSIPHLSALKQCTGEAEYVDDMPPLAEELVGALVLTTKANARIVRVDASRALEANGGPGTHFVDQSDLENLGGSNVWCPPAFDDRFFAGQMSEAAGLIIGVVLARTRREAQLAASLVEVEYESLGEPILDIDAAIHKASFLAARPKIVSDGHTDADFDEDGAWQKCEHVLESNFRMGGQEHFYLETNAVTVIPGREDGEIEVWSSTQNPTETQNFVASVLNVPVNRVTVRLKRLGGGFGGKESRSVLLAATMALACRISGKPVRCMLDRDEDIAISGQRHPFKGCYKIGFNSNGQLMKLDVKIYNNAGWSQDLSRAVLERAMTHVDGCYRWPQGVRVRGWMCKTNTVSNTAFRGFGGPQGMMIIEDAIDKAARSIGLEPDKMRSLNFNREGDVTHFGQPIVDWNVPAMWTQMLESADYDQRRLEVDAFNRQNRWKKRGLTMAGTRFGISFTFKTLNQARCLVHIYAHDGSVMLSHGGTEMGQGLHTKMVQVAATELGIPASKIHIAQTSTREAANTSPTAASAGSDLNGAATKDACDQLKERLKPYLAKADVTWEQAVHSAYIDRVNLSAVGHYKTPVKGMDWENGKGEPFAYWTQGVVCTEAEVDVLTGDSRIVRADVTLDLARSINPGIDIGQIEGAFTQGFGLVTTEESLWKHDGQIATKGPGNYKIPGEFRVGRLLTAF